MEKSTMKRKQRRYRYLKKKKEKQQQHLRVIDTLFRTFIKGMRMVEIISIFSNITVSKIRTIQQKELEKFGFKKIVQHH